MQTKYITVIFDDGPREPLCKMVDKFVKYGFKGGFAIYGRNITDDTEHMLRYAVNNGFTLISHSQTHCHLEELTKRQDIIDELMIPIKEVEKRIGYTMRMARFPYNKYNDETLDVARELNLVLLGNGMNCGADSRPETTPDTIIEKTLNSVCDGAVACMHVTPNTNKALDTILPELKARGYQLVTPEELFKIKGITTAPLGVYINNVNDI